MRTRAESETSVGAADGLARPVAWQVRHHGDNGFVSQWNMCHDEADRPERSGRFRCEYRPLYAAPAQPPAGYRVVPVEPTTDMERAACRAEDAVWPTQDYTEGCWRAVWDAMLAAAPQVGEPQNSKGDVGTTRVAREAEHGPGAIPTTGLREQCKAKADPGDSQDEVAHPVAEPPAASASASAGAYKPCGRRDTPSPSAVPEREALLLRLAEFESEECYCDPAWKDRGMTDPACLACAREDVLCLARDLAAALAAAANQCDGCRRGFVLDNGIHRDGAGRGVMFCTADRYDESGSESRAEIAPTAGGDGDHSEGEGDK